MTEPREVGEKQKSEADAAQEPTLGAEVVKDLEPTSDNADDIRGGARPQTLAFRPERFQ